MLVLINVINNFNFDLIIGDGSFGLVYKVNLIVGVIVVFKKFSFDVF